MHIRQALVRLLHLVGLDGVVVGEERVFLDAEQRKERLVQHLLVHAEHRKDRRLLPRSEADRRAREVRVVRAKHRHGNAEHRGDLLDHLVAPLQVLRRELKRLQVDVASDGEELARLLRAAELVLHLRAEPVELLLARVALRDDEVVGPRLVLEEEVVHLVQRDIGCHSAPRGLDLAESVVHVAGVRQLELDDLLGREVDLLRLGRAVAVAADERLAAARVARHDLDPLARQRPQLHGNIGRVTDHGVQVCVAREFGVQHAQDGRVEAVLVRVDLRQEFQDRMVLGDDLVVVAELRGLGHRVTRRELREVAGKVRLRAASRPARVPELLRAVATAHIEAQRLRCDGDRVEPRGGVDPRTAVRDRCGVAEVGALHIATEQARGAADQHLRGIVVEERLEPRDQGHMTLVISGLRDRRAWTASASAHTPSSCPAVAS